ncbi:MAG: glycosyltransferase [Myxococcales bacterium]|nr:glycosyltransferase [Myxococcales bacterium]
MAASPLAVFVITSASSAEFFRGQLRELVRAGVRVILVSSDDDSGASAADLAAAEGAQYVVVPMRRAMSPWADLRAISQLAQLFRAWRPTLVDGSTPKAALLAMLASKLARVPVAHHTLRGIRHVTLRGPKRWLTFAAQWLTCRLADHTLAISPSLAQQAVALRLAASRKLTVLGAGSSHGVELRYFDPARHAVAGRELRRQLLGTAIGAEPDADAVIVGYFGRLARDKGLATLAQAWAQLATSPRFHLLLVGNHDATDPVDAAAWGALCAQPRVRWLPHQRDLGASYAAVDMLVLPSHREGFGNVLIEAGAMTLPVVASDIVGCRDAVIDGETGTLVPPGDAGALAKALAIYAHQPQLRARHGAAARARAMAAFDARHVAARWVAYLGARCGVSVPPAPTTTIAIDRDATWRDN